MESTSGKELFLLLAELAPAVLQNTGQSWENTSEQVYKTPEPAAVSINRLMKWTEVEVWILISPGKSTENFKGR